jgi:hypothetical protein
MPSVIKEVIIPVQSNLPAGGKVQSNPIDVEGTESVSLNVSITSPNGGVVRKVHFGPTLNGAFALARSDTFAAQNHPMMSIPTLGPKLFVVVENQGASPTKCEAWIYAIRKVP